MSTDSELSIYYSQISRVILLDADTEKELTRRIIRENDSDARQRLIHANLRLVISTTALD